MQTTEEKPVESYVVHEPNLSLWLTFHGGRVLDPPVSFAITSRPTRIGRAAQLEVALDDLRASRLHATVRRADGGSEAGDVLLVDAGSRNGTVVNGERVSEARLVLGDVFVVGDSCFVVSEDPTATPDATIPSIQGNSVAVRRLRALIATVAMAETTVLIEAESGSGKELVARALHDLSGRSGQFVPVNGAAIPESLAESFFFGHHANAFTGAKNQPGVFRTAEHGTLFLDEVGELPAPIQPKLLRVLQDKTIVPLGANMPIACATRVVAATNRNLRIAVEQGRFRGDVLARLAETCITIPPLRERREDVLALFVRGLGDAGTPLTAGVAEALLLHRWPYNIRELLACARDASARNPSKVDLALIGLRLACTATRAGKTAERSKSGTPSARGPRSGERGAIDQVELERLLRVHGGVVARVARAVGRSRKQVYRWIAASGIDIDLLRPSDRPRP